LGDALDVALHVAQLLAQLRHLRAQIRRRLRLRPLELVDGLLLLFDGRDHLLDIVGQLRSFGFQFRQTALALANPFDVALEALLTAL
jgi:hypothetical protein